MERRGVVFLLIIILIIGSFILMFKFQKPNIEELNLSEEEEDYLLELAYRSIKLSINEDKRLIESTQSRLSNYNNEVFVNLWYNGARIGSYTGSAKDLINNVITASIGASKDKERGGIKNNELEDIKIHISILKNKQLITDKSLENIEKEINLKKDEIRVETLDRKGTTYSHYFPLLYNWNHEETLGNLCLKIKRSYPILERFDENCWKDEAFNIYKLEMIEFEKEFITN